jgi:hypothetical protein
MSLGDETLPQYVSVSSTNNVVSTNVVVLLPDSAFNTPVDYRPLIYVMLDYQLLSLEELEYILANYVTITLDALQYASIDLSKLNLTEQELQNILIGYLTLENLEYSTSYADFILVKDEQYNKILAEFERRFDMMLDYVTPKNYRIVPSVVTDLGKRRKDVIVRWMKPKWTSEDELIIQAYYNDLAKAINRRETLNKRRLRK